MTVTGRGSTNGTTVELHGTRRSAVPAPLHVPPGAVIVIGDHSVRVRAVEA